MDPETILALCALLLIAILILLITLTRRIKRMSTQVGTLQQLGQDLSDRLASLNQKVTDIGASVTAEIARVEAAILNLQNQSNPLLDPVIAQLQAVRDGLTAATTNLTTEQTTLDAERPAQ